MISLFFLFLISLFFKGALFACATFKVEQAKACQCVPMTPEEQAAEEEKKAKKKTSTKKTDQENKEEG